MSAGGVVEGPLGNKETPAELAAGGEMETTVELSASWKLMRSERCWSRTGAKSCSKKEKEEMPKEEARDPNKCRFHETGGWNVVAAAAETEGHHQQEATVAKVG